MGYLPIVLAAAAFLLLLCLVNLSSIRSHQQVLGLTLFQVCQTAKSRHTLMRAIQELPLNQLCPELPATHQLLPRSIPHMTPFLEAEHSSVKELGFFLKDKRFMDTHARLLPPLEVLNQRQHINLRTFERKVREYNQLLESSPTRLVAQLWRIKPIRFASVHG
ncbi:hypothetical protein [Cesiribacter andamanensis]|uniref:Uncharacterized protein n=1 Tax=Cesiribacter andamanensis AMV16 TaxID=1279009 RepID=M7N3E0_9BACT|nr:hypothetical protein [Cesiribacter andamanensis]EMR03203.1 hypothetical protein ADICEAN_01681 [Cesiribacter andamanensis AMV16]